MSKRGNYQFEKFNSPTYGGMGWEEVIGRVGAYIKEDPKASYELIIGTDSQAQNGDADFVSAVIVHRERSGGVYFWTRQTRTVHSLKERIWEEAIMSLSLAEKLSRDFLDIGFFGLNLEIHVDIGPNGKTRELISEIVNMIRANGYGVATKPQSWGASRVADRHV